MTTLGTNGKNFPLINGLAAVIITFMLLTLCTQLAKYTPAPPKVKYDPIFYDYVPPPDLPDPAMDETINPEPLKPTNIKPTERVPFDPVMPALNNGINTNGTITITTVKPGGFIKAPPKVIDIFKPGQVDRNPRVLRPVAPNYPLDAQRRGIEGRVVLRFVVDENGQVQNPEVIKAEPEGVFEQAALEAIVKYKFDPAMIDKKKVKCFVVLPIGFRLN
jgi:periplasmic protein TonB